jgi:protein-tyrosine phosphatase
MHVRHMLRHDLPYTDIFGTYVKLSNTLYYGMHPSRVAPNVKIDHYVSLVQDHEIKDFDTTIPTYKFPIKDRRAPTLEYLGVIVNFILTLKGVVYVYCRSGIGRSGTIAAALWGKLHSLSAEDSLTHINTQWHAQRNLAALKPHLVKLGSPQTNCQKNIVQLYLQ